MDNSLLFNFTKESSFLFDLREKKYESLIENIDDLNNLKPDENDMLFLNKLINENKINQTIMEGSSDEYDILPKYKDSLLEFTPGILKYNEKMKIIFDIFNTITKRENVSLKRICKKYKRRTKNNISESYVKGILNNKFNIKYLRTTAKTNKLNAKSSKLRKFIFIKVVIHALKLGLKIIFVDESNFQLENCHLKVWRKSKELPFFKIGPRGRRNIIAAISDEELLLYKINSGTNNRTTFLEYMNELVKILNNKGINNSLIIMDNCSIHLTKELQKFYEDNKLKIMTIVPNASELNAIELLFNYIKQKIYKRVFSSFYKLISFVENILSEESTNEVINKIFIKSMNIYKEFIITHKSEDFNENKKIK